MNVHLMHNKINGTKLKVFDVQYLSSAQHQKGLNKPAFSVAFGNYGFKSEGGLW